MQNIILNLEKKYFKVLENIITSDSFLKDLVLIEKEIRENYPKIKNRWKIKNKIKIPAERIIRHHIYMNLYDSINGIYPSPISSDLGIKLNDCILCVDAKTVDTISNSVDIDSTQVEPNQISFQNTNHKYIKTVSSLESIDHYSRLPVITYIIKIIYNDDDYSFKLSRGSKPSLVLVCIPNGELSNLFDYDIIENFKTYNYYSENENPCFKPKDIPKKYDTLQKRRKYVEDYCVNHMGFPKTIIETNKRSKPAYIDVANQVLWWETTINKKPVIRAVKSGSNARLSNEILKNRFDSNNIPWNGYKEVEIPDELP